MNPPPAASAAAVRQCTASSSTWVTFQLPSPSTCRPFCWLVSSTHGCDTGAGAGPVPQCPTGDYGIVNFVPWNIRAPCGHA